MKEMKNVSRILAIFLILINTSISHSSQSAVRRGNTHIRSISDDSGSHQDQRSLSSLWGFFSFIHPPHLKPKSGSNSSSNSGNGNGSGSGNGSGNGNGNGNGNGQSNSGSSATSDGSNSGYGYDSGTGYYGYDSGTSNSVTDNSGGSGATTGSKQGVSDFFKSTTGKVSAITLAAVAASVAFVAMFMGSKNRNASEKKHALKGILKQRMGLFSRMANRSNCATCRPESVENAVLEGSESDKSPSTDYRLA